MKRYKTKTINGIKMYQSRDGWRCCDDRYSEKEMREQETKYEPPEIQETEKNQEAQQPQEPEKTEIETQEKIKVPNGKMAVMLGLYFDDSHMQVDYFRPHRQIESHLVAIVTKQAQRQSLARQIIERIPELSRLDWAWNTENYSMGHGNYLQSGVVEKRKHKAYDGREEVNCWYEINFHPWECEEIPHSKFYLGDLTEEQPKQQQPKDQTPENPGSNGNLKKTVRKNAKKKGIEIFFDHKPDSSILAALKANGWRWSKFAGLWYHRDTTENLQFAESL